MSKDTKQKRGHRLVAYVTDELMEAVREAAEADGRTVSTWAHRQIVAGLIASERARRAAASAARAAIEARAEALDGSVPHHILEAVYEPVEKAVITASYKDAHLAASETIPRAVERSGGDRVYRAVGRAMDDAMTVDEPIQAETLDVLRLMSGGS